MRDHMLVIVHCSRGNEQEEILSLNMPSSTIERTLSISLVRSSRGIGLQRACACVSPDRYLDLPSTCLPYFIVRGTNGAAGPSVLNSTVGGNQCKGLLLTLLSVDGLLDTHMAYSIASFCYACFRSSR